jgi:hypothetical protein
MPNEYKLNQTELVNNLGAIVNDLLGGALGPL